jgi:hypothetical protein
MVPFDRNSGKFQRDMALHFLDEHRNAVAFRSRLSEDTAAALRELGCIVSRPDADGVCTVTSTVPFGRLMTSRENRAHRLEILGGICLAIFFFGGVRVVYVGALYLGMGEGTATLWFLGWFVLSGIVFNLVNQKSDANSDERSILLYLILIVLLFFGAGVVVHLIGWSGN